MGFARGLCGDAIAAGKARMQGQRGLREEPRGGGGAMAQSPRDEEVPESPQGADQVGHEVSGEVLGGDDPMLVADGRRARHEHHGDEQLLLEGRGLDEFAEELDQQQRRQDHQHGSLRRGDEEDEQDRRDRDHAEMRRLGLERGENHIHISQLDDHQSNKSQMMLQQHQGIHHQNQNQHQHQNQPEQLDHHMEMRHHSQQQQQALSGQPHTILQQGHQHPHEINLSPQDDLSQRRFAGNEQQLLDMSRGNDVSATSSPSTPRGSGTASRRSSEGRRDKPKRIRCDCKLAWCAERRQNELPDEVDLQGKYQHFSTPKCPLQRHEVLQALRPHTPEKSSRSNFVFLWWHLRPSSFMWVAEFDKRSKNRTPRWFVGRQKLSVSSEYEPPPPAESFALFDQRDRKWIISPDSPFAKTNGPVALVDGSRVSPSRQEMPHLVAVTGSALQGVSPDHCRSSSDTPLNRKGFESSHKRMRLEEPVDVNGNTLVSSIEDMLHKPVPSTLNDALEYMHDTRGILERILEVMKDSGIPPSLHDQHLIHHGIRGSGDHYSANLGFPPTPFQTSHLHSQSYV